MMTTLLLTLPGDFRVNRPLTRPTYDLGEMSNMELLLLPR